MPPTSTNTQLPMLITRNIKLSKLKIISSPSTRYYTILQTQTREKNQAVKNVQQLWCYTKQLPETTDSEAQSSCFLTTDTPLLASICLLFCSW